MVTVPSGVILRMVVRLATSTLPTRIDHPILRVEELRLEALAIAGSALVQLPREEWSRPVMHRKAMHRV